MGGALAVQFALDHPELSEGLVCAASNSGPGEHEGGLRPENWPSLAGTKRALLASFHDKSLVTEAFVRARFEDRLRVNDGYTVARHLADHRAPYSVKELSAIRVPALFVWCREDEITPSEVGRGLCGCGSGCAARGHRGLRPSAESREASRVQQGGDRVPRPQLPSRKIRVILQIQPQAQVWAIELQPADRQDFHPASREIKQERRPT